MQLLTRNEIEVGSSRTDKRQTAPQETNAEPFRSGERELNRGEVLAQCNPRSFTAISGVGDVFIPVIIAFYRYRRRKQSKNNIN